MDIIKQIEDEQLRKENYDFHVGDTVVLDYRICLLYTSDAADE